MARKLIEKAQTRDPLHTNRRENLRRITQMVTEATAWFEDRDNYATIQVVKGTKTPAIRTGEVRYSELEPGDHIPASWACDSQDGIVCSESTGLFVDDVDDPEEYAQTSTGKLFPPIAATVTRGNHFHVYILCDCPRYPKQGPKRGHDIKANGFVVAPGGVHKSGEKYGLAGFPLIKCSPEIHDSIDADPYVYKTRDGGYTAYTQFGRFSEFMAEQGWESFEDIPDNTFGQFNIVYPFVGALAMSGMSYDDAAEVWERVVYSIDEADPWTVADHFDKYWESAERKWRKDIDAKRAEMAWQGSMLGRGRLAEVPEVPTSKPLPAEAPEQAPDSNANDLEDVAEVTGPPTLPDEFWDLSEALRGTRAYAHDWGYPADATLISVLARIAAYVPHDVKLDTGIKRPVSLNFLGALCGRSGAGKSSTNSHAGHCSWSQGAISRNFPFGTGEGLAEAYMGTVEKLTGELDSKRQPKVSKVRAQTEHNAFFYADEGAGMVELMNRSGSTLGSQLRSAWSGETLGQQNGRSENTRIIDDYALGAIVGFQPASIAPLLSEVHLGTSQRFVFVMATDPNIPEDYTRSAPAPKITIPSKVIHESYEDNGEVVPGSSIPGRVTITVAPEITAMYKARDHAVNTGSMTPDPGTEHDMLLQGKIAALLLILENGGTMVTRAQWEAAGMILENSHRTRDYMNGLAAGIEFERRRHLGAMAGVQDAARNNVVSITQRAEEKVRKLADDGLTPSEIRDRLTKPQLKAIGATAGIRALLAG